MLQGKVGANGRGGRNSRWVLFILPFVTVLREGLEAVIFVGGVSVQQTKYISFSSKKTIFTKVSLGQPATSIPLAAIVGLICGLLVGYLIYASSSRTSA